MRRRKNNNESEGSNNHIANVFIDTLIDIWTMYNENDSRQTYFVAQVSSEKGVKKHILISTSK